MSLKFNHFCIFIAAAFCFWLLFSCTTNIEPPPKPSGSSSSAGEPSYCIYPQERLCIPGTQTDCPSGGILSNACPYSSSSVAVSSSSTSASSSGSAPSSSSSVAIPSSYSVASSSSISTSYCFYGAGNCHKMPTDDNCASGVLVENCNNIAASSSSSATPSSSSVVPSSSSACGSNGQGTMCLWNGSGDCLSIKDQKDREACGMSAWIFQGGTQGSGSFCSGGTFVCGKDSNPPVSTGSSSSYGISSSSGIPTSSPSVTLSSPEFTPQTFNSTSSSITISWLSIKGATGYHIYRSTTFSGTYTLIGTSTTTSYTDTELTANTTYYYRVSAYNGGGEGSQSEYIGVGTQLSTPTNVTATVVSSTRITVSWSSVTGATSYRIYRSTTSSGTYTQIGTTTSTSYTNTSLTEGTTYYYKVAAYNGGGIVQSEAVSATPLSRCGSVWYNASIPNQYCSQGTVKTYGTVSDGVQDYKTVVINDQTWMAEDLRYNVSGSKCYANNCTAMSSRYYTWTMAMDLESTYNYTLYSAADKHRGICPSGWHIPSDAEWIALIHFLNPNCFVVNCDIAGRYLKATNGWSSDGNGTDDYGFAAYATGVGSLVSLTASGYDGFWWSASEYDAKNAYYRDMSYNNDIVHRGNYDKVNTLLSVRCLKD